MNSVTIFGQGHFIQQKKKSAFYVVLKQVLCLEKKHKKWLTSANQKCTPLFMKKDLWFWCPE